MRRAGALTAFLLAATALGAADAWYQAYEKGLKAIAARQWDDAERHLKAAAASGPRPGRQVRAYGMRFMDFIPGYHLGIVYFNQQRYREAIEELQRVEASGLVARGDPEHARLAEVLEQASARQMARATPSPLVARPPTSAPSEPPREVDTLLAYARERLESGNLEGARQALEAARAKDPGHTGLAAVAEALGRREADQRAQAEQVARDGETARRGQVETLVQDALRLGAAGRAQEARAAAARARSAGVNDPRLDALVQRLDVDQDVAELARLVSAQDFAAARGKAAVIARKDPRHPELLLLQAALDRQLAAPVEIERAGVRAFYGGRYDSAIELLAPLAADRAPSPRALFYLACSHAALGLMKGTDGMPSMTRARELFARVRASRPMLAEKEKRFISPRIRRLFETG